MTDAFEDMIRRVESKLGKSERQDLNADLEINLNPEQDVRENYTRIKTALHTSHLGNAGMDLDVYYNDKETPSGLEDAITERDLECPNDTEIRFYLSGEQMVRDAVYHGTKLDNQEIHTGENEISHQDNKVINGNARHAADTLLNTRETLAAASENLFLYGTGDLGHMIFVNQEKAREIAGENHEDLAYWSGDMSAVRNSQLSSIEMEFAQELDANENYKTYPHTELYSYTNNLQEPLLEGHARAMVRDMYPRLAEVAERHVDKDLEVHMAEEFMADLADIGGWELANTALSYPPEDQEDLLDPEGYAERFRR